MTSQQPHAADEEGWSWDPSLYEGSAGFYAAGRMPYPAEVADVLVAALGLDGSGRLLDVGCGPGSLTLLLAPHVFHAIGLDADAAMVAEASRLAREQGVTNVSWRRLRAEELPADLPPVRLVTFAQSFHWMDRPRVASAARDLLTPDGAVVHVHATTHRGEDLSIDVEADEGGGSSAPPPPWPAITELVQRHLGPVRRAGQGVLPAGTAGGESDVYRGAGLQGPQRLAVPGRTVHRTPDQVAAAVFSLSSSAPHLFGPGLASFDRELRELLDRHVGADGAYAETTRPVAIDIWRPA